jgi:hypothetical protein
VLLPLAARAAGLKTLSARLPGGGSDSTSQAGLRELIYVEGKNLKVEYRFGGDQLETLHKFALELVALGPDAIVIQTASAAIAAKRATKTIPIVMALVADPVRSSIIDTLAHPGGNITGVTLYASELSGKRMEVLKEAVQCCYREPAHCTPARRIPHHDPAIFE